MAPVVGWLASLRLREIRSTPAPTVVAASFGAPEGQLIIFTRAADGAYPRSPRSLAMDLLTDPCARGIVDPLGEAETEEALREIARAPASLARALPNLELAVTRLANHQPTLDLRDTIADHAQHVFTLLFQANPNWEPEEIYNALHTNDHSLFARLPYLTRLLRAARHQGVEPQRLAKAVEAAFMSSLFT